MDGGVWLKEGRPGKLERAAFQQFSNGKRSARLDSLEIAGVGIDAWLDAFDWSYSLDASIPRASLVTWPDGRPYTEQENIVVEVFKVIESQWLKANRRR